MSSPPRAEILSLLGVPVRTSLLLVPMIVAAAATAANSASPAAATSSATVMRVGRFAMPVYLPKSLTDALPNTRASGRVAVAGRFYTPLTAGTPSTIESPDCSRAGCDTEVLAGGVAQFG